MMNIINLTNLGTLNQTPFSLTKNKIKSLNNLGEKNHEEKTYVKKTNTQKQWWKLK